MRSERRAARIPKHSCRLAAVDQTGKILGLLRLIALLRQGLWPITPLVLSLLNDLLGWRPFILCLVDAPSATTVFCSPWQ